MPCLNPFEKKKATQRGFWISVCWERLPYIVTGHSQQIIDWPWEAVVLEDV